jgi:GNAT superfamily N-acetyltransferase/DNA-binding MarR family transcriptional regulator
VNVATSRSQDVVVLLGELALASRLKRLGDRLSRDVTRVYQALDSDFEARWFTLLHALGRSSPQGVTQLAQALGLSHAAVNQIASPMLRRGLLSESRDGRDDRRRLLRLSARGRKLMRDLDPIWKQIRAANQDLLREAAVDLLGDLGRVEVALDRLSMQERIRARLRPRGTAHVEIADYRPAYKKHFGALSRQWLEKYFTVEPADARLLGDPNGQIVHKGGAILFALVNEEVVGTCALIRHAGDVFELAKMAVAEAAQGRGIGRALAQAVMARARAMGAHDLYLQTSPVLTVACKLYRKLGFRRLKHHPLPADKYHRCTITMRRRLA